MSSDGPQGGTGAALDTVADALYALPPEDFTAARDAAAKEDPALRKEVVALRRPTAAAWLVNVLAREDPRLLEQLLDLGPALAEAQRTGAATDLRALSDQRRALLAAVATRAVELGGRDTTAAVRLEVEATLDAALADPDAAAAVRAGRLVRALSFAGFGGVDLDGATATPAPAARATGAQKAPPKAGSGGGAKSTSVARAEAAEQERLAVVAAAEQAAHDAAGRLDDAVQVLSSAQQAAATAAEATHEATEAVAAAEAALEAARARRTDSAAAERAASRDLATAERKVSSAQAKAERARAALDQLRRD